MKPASPNLPCGSSALPERTTRCAATTGSSCDSTRYTLSPLSRANTLAAGSGAVEIGPALGAWLRHASFDSTLAAVFSVAAGAGGLDGSTFSPGTPYTTTRLPRASWVAANCLTPVAVTAA
ncbi:MAG: hypothetical protein A2V63_12255 [Candidatus Eisenbacteria bacterium RBG_19FT_COMBO_70_11]|nr:MAG: hypothetical protein A2V63_12255 [Candidatus Eisenbacteria bacterium RBG_19FT_COMBO_70_11]